MSITYTWKITGVKTRDEGPLKDAVVQTYWEKIGTTDTGVEGKFSGATPFSAAGMEPGSFVPFENLTEAVVLGWIQGVVTGSYEEHVNQQIQKQIDEKSSPVVDKPLPWAPAPTTPNPAPAAP